MKRFIRSLWKSYCRVTGYEKALLQRRTGLKIQSTCYPGGSHE